MKANQGWQNRWKRRLTPRLLLWLAPLALLSPALRPGYALFWGTASLQFIPWHWWAWQTLRQGHLPLWNPLLGGGAPLLANYQSALLYPPNWLLVPFAALGGLEGMAWAHGLLAAAHLIFAGLGMARLLDDFNALEPAPTVAGLAYALSGYLVARLGFFSINAATAWLPWLLWASRGVAQQPTRRNTALLSLLWGLQLLAGHAQTAWYSGLLMVLWALWWLRKPYGKRLAALVGAALLGVALAAAQLLPTAVYLLQSQRAGGAPAWALDYSLWPWHFITLIAPNAFGTPAHGDYWGFGAFWEDAMYVGMLPLLLALYALRRGKPRRAVSWALVVLALGFVLALGKHTPVFMWLYTHVPTFNAFKAPARWLLWGEVALAFLSGLGVAAWRRPEGRALYWTRLGTAGAFAVAVGAGLAWYFAGDVKPTMVRSVALGGLWALGTGLLALVNTHGTGISMPRLGEQGWAWAVALWVAVDLLMAGWGLNPALPAAEVYSATPPRASQAAAQAGEGRVYLPPGVVDTIEFKHYFRFKNFLPPADGWGGLRASLLPNLTLLDGVATANNFDPLLPRRMERYERGAWAQPPPVRERLWARWGVRVVVQAADEPPYREMLRPLAVSEPLARWVPRAIWVTNGEAAWREVTQRAREGGAAWQCTVVLEGKPQPNIPACSTTWSVTAEKRTPNLETWYVQAPQEGGFVVFSEVWYPGWEALVDGKPTRLYRADYLFRAVAVPAGEHRVIMRYRPRAFYAGLLLSLLALGAFVVLMYRARPTFTPTAKTR